MANVVVRSADKKNDSLYSKSTITYTGSALGRDLLMAIMNVRNNYGKQKLFYVCMYVHTGSWLLS